MTVSWEATLPDGARGILRKPMDLDKLLSTVRSLYAQTQHIGL